MRLGVIVFFCLFTANLIAQDTLMIRDLTKDLYYFDTETSTYLPVVDFSAFSDNRVSFRLDRNDQVNGLTYLYIETDESLSLFINDKLAVVLENEVRYLTLDSLWDIYGNPMQFTIYNEQLDIRELELRILLSSRGNEQNLDLNQVVVVSIPRSGNAFSDFFAIALLIVLIIAATLYNYTARLLLGFFNVQRAFSAREIEEQLTKGRSFSGSYINIYVFHALMVALILTALAYHGIFSARIVAQFTSFWKILLIWIQVALVLLFWIVLKQFIIYSFTSLFNIRSVFNNHFYNYIRLGLIFSTISLLAIVLHTYIFGASQNGFYTIFLIYVAALIVRSLIIFLKLMGMVRFKFFHLFSYLCATELIPLSMMIFLGFNQPF